MIVQALEPDSRALRHAARHDAEGFVRGELERRRLLGYPPYTQLVRVVCSAGERGPETPAAAAVAARVSASLGEGDAALASPDAPGGGAVLGPARLFRLKGRERMQVLIKAGAHVPAVPAVRRAVEAVAAERSSRDVAFAVDVDPH